MLLIYNFHKILLLHGAITVHNLKVIANSQIELWFFKVANLDVCGSLVLSNPVTNNVKSAIDNYFYDYRFMLM